MAFVNEYISEEDMEKYNIREIWRSFYPRSNNIDELIEKYTWTVDKEQRKYFFPVASGREAESNQQTCVFGYDGIILTVVLAKVGGYLDFSAKKGSITWELIHISIPEHLKINELEIISSLKEALTIYQLDGIKHPMIDYPVAFIY